MFLPGQALPALKPAGGGGGGGSGGDSGAAAAGAGPSSSDASLVLAAAQRKREKLAAEQGFRTKAMRDLDRMRRVAQFSRTLLRVRLPDGTHVQAAFRPTESMADVEALLRDCVLSEECCSRFGFHLYVTPPRKRLPSDGTTLEALQLVPAARASCWRGSHGHRRLVRTRQMAAARA